MRAFFCVITFLTVLSIMPAAGYAQGQISADYLRQVCELDEKGQEVVAGGHAACQAYISGVLDYHLFMQSLKMAPNLRICIPESVTLNELHVRVLLYLRRNRHHDGFVAAPAVTTALYEFYPCY